MSAMRIIAGKWGGRQLAAFRAPNVRPTTDRVREAVFSAVHAALMRRGEDFEDVCVADLFAGTGALGFEALSRGAASLTLVESSRRAVAVIRKNIESLQAGGQARLIARDVLEWLGEEEAESPACGLVFADPPYGLGKDAQLLDLIARSAKVAPGALVVMERGARNPAPEPPAGLETIRSREYGDTAVDFYEKEA